MLGLMEKGKTFDVKDSIGIEQNVSSNTRSYREQGLITVPQAHTLSFCPCLDDGVSETVSLRH